MPKKVVMLPTGAAEMDELDTLERVPSPYPNQNPFASRLQLTTPEMRQMMRDKMGMNLKIQAGDKELPPDTGAVGTTGEGDDVPAQIRQLMLQRMMVPLRKRKQP